MSMLSDVARDKLQRFVARISFTMSEQLQALVIASIDEFTSYLEFYRARKGSPDLAGRASRRRHSIYGGLEKSMSETVFASFEQENPKDPLFRLFLVVEGDHLVFKPSIDLVRNTIVELLEDMVTSLQGAEGLQSRLRSLFSYDMEPTILQSLALEDPRVTAARETAEVVWRPQSSLSNFRFLGNPPQLVLWYVFMSRLNFPERRNRLRYFLTSHRMQRLAGSSMIALEALFSAYRKFWSSTLLCQGS